MIDNLAMFNTESQDKILTRQYLNTFSDHHVSYSMYLSIICGEGETKSQPPKVIENIFNTIKNLLCKKVEYLVC